MNTHLLQKGLQLAPREATKSWPSFTRTCNSPLASELMDPRLEGSMGTNFSAIKRLPRVPIDVASSCSICQKCINEYGTLFTLLPTTLNFLLKSSTNALASCVGEYNSTATANATATYPILQRVPLKVTSIENRVTQGQCNFTEKIVSTKSVTVPNS